MKRGNFFVALLCAIVVVTAIGAIVGLQSKLNELKEDYAELEAVVTQYKDKVDGLKYELEQELDDDYIGRVARERLGYHVPGEKIYYFGGYGK